MGDRSRIEWTDATWNPIRGCSRVSEGCRNCYAEREAARFSGPGQPYEGLAEVRPAGPRWTGEVRLVESALEVPLRWKKPRRIFVNSTSDLFHEKLREDWLHSIFQAMVEAPQHIYQMLTKRVNRMRDVLQQMRKSWSLPSMRGCPGDLSAAPNIWWGVSVEDQKTADERIPVLLDTPAAVRWVSAEPLLGVVSMCRLQGNLGMKCDLVMDALRGEYVPAWKGRDTIPDTRCGKRLHWVVVGGESGPNARPMHPDWVRSLRDQCEAAGVPFFFKQWGEWCPESQLTDYELATRKSPVRRNGDFWRTGKKRAGRLLDGREWNEYPASADPKMRV